MRRELARENMPTETFGAVYTDELIVAKTADRSLAGCMNDMAFLCEHAIARSGGLQYTDLADLDHALRRNINSPAIISGLWIWSPARMRDAY
jgi:hypothetical protein